MLLLQHTTKMNLSRKSKQRSNSILKSQHEFSIGQIRSVMITESNIYHNFLSALTNSEILSVVAVKILKHIR